MMLTTCGWLLVACAAIAVALFCALTWAAWHHPPGTLGARPGAPRARSTAPLPGAGPSIAADR